MTSYLELWSTLPLLRSKSDKVVSIREFTDENLDFLGKNYKFISVPWGEMVDKIFDEGEKNREQPRFYFRSIGENARKDVSDIRQTLPELAEDFILPESFSIASKRFFSRLVLLLSSYSHVCFQYFTRQLKAHSGMDALRCHG